MANPNENIALETPQPQTELTTQPGAEGGRVETEETAPLKGRARLAAQFKEQNPEADYDDDEQFDSALDEYDNARSEELDHWHDIDTKLRDAIDKDPRTGQFLSNILDGQDVVNALIDCVGPELTEAVSSPEARARLDQLRQEAEETERKRNENIDESLKVFDEFFADKDQSDMDGFSNYIEEHFNRLATGEFTRDDIEMLWKGYKHDDDVAEAESDGEIKGRNQRIIERRETLSTGDGVPSLRSLADNNSPARPKVQPKGSIWDR
jgi:hypothetical protein